MSFPTISGSNFASKSDGVATIEEFAKTGTSSAYVAVHSTGCGYCRAFMPTWRQAKRQALLGADPVAHRMFELETKDMRSIENEALMDALRGGWVPRVIKITPSYSSSGDRVLKHTALDKNWATMTTGQILDSIRGATRP